MKLQLIWLLSTLAITAGFMPVANNRIPRTAVVLNERGTNTNDMMPLVRGSTCALITPFTNCGRIDVPGLQQLLQWHLDGGTDNLCILGTTAEAAVLSMQERATILKTCVDKVKGKIPLLVGTGTVNPDSVKDMTQQAIDMGADANLLVTPYYVKPPQRCLVQHFTSIADMGLPTVLYNVPGRTACNLEDQTIVTLADHPSIVGIKDATGDLDRLQSLKWQWGLGGDAYDDVNSETDRFLFLSGDDSTTKNFCLAGGDGCISVTANIVPHMMHDLVHAALQGKVRRANEIDHHLEDLHQQLFVESNPIACKWAAKRIGLIETDYCKPPLAALDPKYESIVDQALHRAGFLGVSRLQEGPSKHHHRHLIETHHDSSIPFLERVEDHDIWARDNAWH